MTDDIEDRGLRAMTLEGARDTAAGMADRFGVVFVVFRYPGWPAHHWSVRRKEDVASNAIIVATFEAEHRKPKTEPTQPQGSLF